MNCRLLAVATIVVAVHVAVALAFAGGVEGEPNPILNRDLFLGVAIGTLALILGGTLYKTVALSFGGGKAVAEGLGGRRVAPDSTDPALLSAEEIATLKGEAPVGGAADAFALEPARFAAAVGQVSAPQLAAAARLLEGLESGLQGDFRSADGARAVVYALLLNDGAEAQPALLEEAEGEPMRRRAEGHRQWLAGVDATARLPLLDLALPALHGLDPVVRERLHRTARRLIEADRKVNLFEYAVGHILRRRLPLPGEGRKRARSTIELPEVRADIALLLTLLARVGASGDEAAAASFAAATALAPLDGPWQREEWASLKLDRLDRALERLEGLPPKFKKRLVAAAAAAVAAVANDGRVTAAEGELLRAVCEGLGVPAPLLAG